jgi:hypothetical protein
LLRALVVQLTGKQVGQFLHVFSLKCYAPPPLSTANLATFFIQTAASSLSDYVSETNVVAKVTDSTINRTPCIALAKPLEINRTFVFHPFLDTTPKSNGQLGLFKTQLTASWGQSLVDSYM